MMTVWLYALISVLIVGLISLVGLFLLSLSRKVLENTLFALIALAVGALFGDVFLHIIPEITEGVTDWTQVGTLIFAGILIFFALEKFLRWHHGHTDEIEHDKEDHDHDGHPDSMAHDGHLKHLGHINLFSDGLHNFIDGIVIGASYLVSIPVGIATTIAVAIHEIPQEVGDFGILLHSGYTRRRALYLNFLFALTSIVGVVLALAIGERVEGFIDVMLPITAGGFIYIAGSDIVPELHKTIDWKRSFVQFFAIVIGFFAMYLLLFLE